MSEITLYDDLALPVAKYCDSRTILSFFHSAKKFSNIWKYILEIRYPDYVQSPNFSHIETYFLLSGSRSLNIIYDASCNFLLTSLYESVSNSVPEFEIYKLSYCLLLNRYIIFDADCHSYNNPFNDYNSVILFVMKRGFPIYIIDLSTVQITFDKINIHRTKNKKSITYFNGSKFIEH